MSHPDRHSEYLERSDEMYELLDSIEARYRFEGANLALKVGDECPHCRGEGVRDVDMVIGEVLHSVPHGCYDCGSTGRVLCAPCEERLPETPCDLCLRRAA